MKRWILGAVLLAVGCNNAPSEDQCTHLLDHLIELEFKKGGVAANESTKAEITKQKAAVAEARTAEFIETCTKRTARSRIDCALSANDLDAVARCDEVKP